MLVSSADPALLNSKSTWTPLFDFTILQSLATGTAAQSPFVIAINRAGVKGIFGMSSAKSESNMKQIVLPHIINAGVFTSAFSAGNSFLFCSSRILYGLALRGQAPKIFARCTKKGLPIFAVAASVSDPPLVTVL